jgi:hypothetical protein
MNVDNAPVLPRRSSGRRSLAKCEPKRSGLVFWLNDSTVTRLELGKDLAWKCTVAEDAFDQRDLKRKLTIKEVQAVALKDDGDLNCGDYGFGRYALFCVL